MIFFSNHKRHLRWLAPSCILSGKMYRDLGKRASCLFLILVACGILAGCGPHPAQADALELFTGWIGPQNSRLVGRFHEGSVIEFGEGTSSLTDARKNLRSLLQDGKANYEVLITLTDENGKTKEIKITTDEHGYIRLDRSQLPVSTMDWTSPIKVTATTTKWFGLRSFTADPVKIPVFDNKERIGAISDVDDTVIATDVLHKTELIEHSIFGDPFTVKSFADAAKTLSAIANGDNPVAFVSGSPWSFYRRTIQKLHRDGFPEGAPLILKEVPGEPLRDQVAYKVPHILEIMDSLPKVKWLLFGDSGEFDPEVYTAVYKKYPDRVKGIFIHFVTDDQAEKSREVKLGDGKTASYPLNDPSSGRFKSDSMDPTRPNMFVFRNWADLPSDMKTGPNMPFNTAIRSLDSVPSHDVLWGFILKMAP